jgi:hypothetical protein
VELLRKAYASPDRIAIGDDLTLAIAGTNIGSWSDIATDALYPFGLERLVPNNRFSLVEPLHIVDFPRVIGHSLGGAVAAEFPNSVGYDPYVLPWRKAPSETIRHFADPVSVFARRPTNVYKFTTNPHSLDVLG